MRADIRRLGNLFVAVFFVSVLASMIAGCASTLKKGSAGTADVFAQRENAVQAIKTVSEALSGKKLSNEDAVNLTKSIVKDKGARSAIEEIGNAVVPGRVRVKYSPATGKRYSADMEYCPETGVKLLPVE